LGNSDQFGKGKVKLNSQPLPGSLFTLIAPLCLSTNSFTTISPKPVPFSPCRKLVRHHLE